MKPVYPPRPKTWDEAVAKVRGYFSSSRTSWAWEGEVILEDPAKFEAIVLKTAKQWVPELAPPDEV